MTRIWGGLLILILLSGCASVQTVTPSTRELTKEEQIQTGMSREEVKGIMGDSIVIGYQLSEDDKDHKFLPIILKNPYSAEILRHGDKISDAAFYYTTVKEPDGKITDDELTPFVFEDNKLVGKGWYFLEKTKKDYQL